MASELPRKQFLMDAEEAPMMLEKIDADIRTRDGPGSCGDS
jgi:hypothetical protein